MTKYCTICARPVTVANEEEFRACGHSEDPKLALPKGWQNPKPHQHFRFARDERKVA